MKEKCKNLHLHQRKERLLCIQDLFGSHFAAEETLDQFGILLPLRFSLSSNLFSSSFLYPRANPIKNISYGALFFNLGSKEPKGYTKFYWTPPIVSTIFKVQVLTKRSLMFQRFQTYWRDKNNCITSFLIKKLILGHII